MSSQDTSARRGRAALAAASLSALLVSVGCSGARGISAASVQEPGSTPVASQAGLPIAVSCEPGQRTIVRPTIVNGTAMSQVECVTGDARQQLVDAAPSAAVGSTPFVTTPVGYATTARDGRDLGDAEVLPVSTRATPARARQVVYRAPRHRTVKKSAIIVGSSAGIGAGVGAAVGGKKGALIGAALGGGSAALWDQITRRNH